MDTLFNLCCKTIREHKIPLPPLGNIRFLVNSIPYACYDEFDVIKNANIKCIEDFVIHVWNNSFSKKNRTFLLDSNAMIYCWNVYIGDYHLQYIIHKKPEIPMNVGNNCTDIKVRCNIPSLSKIKNIKHIISNEQGFINISGSLNIDIDMQVFCTINSCPASFFIIISKPNITIYFHKIEKVPITNFW